MDNNTLLDIKEYIENITGIKLKINLPCYSSESIPNIGCCEEKADKIYTDEERLRILGHAQDTFIEYFWFLLRESNQNLDEFIINNNLSNSFKEYNYEPTKEEAIKIALILKMNLDDTLSFIGRSGYFINKKDTFDLIIRYCINHSIYNLIDINFILKAFNQKNI